MSDCQVDAMNSSNNATPWLGLLRVGFFFFLHPIYCMLLCTACDVMLRPGDEAKPDIQMEHRA